jgi:hypothetical protein
MMETKTAVFDCAAHPVPFQQAVDPVAIAVNGVDLGAAMSQRQQRASAAAELDDAATVADQMAVQSGLAPRHCPLIHASLSLGDQM